MEAEIVCDNVALPGFRTGLVQPCPLLSPKPECLFTPCTEGDGVDDGRLLDLAAGKDAPRDGDWLQFLDIRVIERGVVVQNLKSEDIL